VRHSAVVERELSGLTFPALSFPREQIRVISAAMGTTDSKDAKANPPATAAAAAKSGNPSPTADKLTMEVVAGTPFSIGHADGPLLACRLCTPIALCLYDGHLIVADSASHTIRLIDGVVSVPPAQHERVR
jgi:hypothetical protein